MWKRAVRFVSGRACDRLAEASPALCEVEAGRSFETCRTIVRHVVLLVQEWRASWHLSRGQRVQRRHQRGAAAAGRANAALAVSYCVRDREAVGVGDRRLVVVGLDVLVRRRPVMRVLRRGNGRLSTTAKHHRSRCIALQRERDEEQPGNDGAQNAIHEAKSTRGKTTSNSRSSSRRCAEPPPPSSAGTPNPHRDLSSDGITHS